MAKEENAVKKVTAAEKLKSVGKKVKPKDFVTRTLSIVNMKQTEKAQATAKRVVKAGEVK